MAHVEAAVDVPVEAEALWRQVGSFQAVADWHPLLVSVTTDGEEPGAVREAVRWDGEKQVERLVEVDGSAHRYRYAIESTILPVTDCVGEFRVEPSAGEASTVRWSNDFELTDDAPRGTARIVLAYLEAGLEGIERRFGPPSE